MNARELTNQISYLTLNRQRGKWNRLPTATDVDVLMAMPAHYHDKALTRLFNKRAQHLSNNNKI